MSDGEQKIRVVLADDHAVLRAGLKALLNVEPDIEVVAACEDLPSLLDAIESEEPHVVLTDIRMPPTSQDEGIQVADRLRETNPETGVVVLSQFAAPEYALALLEQGADRRAYLLKDRVGDAAQLAGAIREVAGGGSVIDPKVVEALVAARARSESPLDDLTPREREIMQWVAAGKTDEEIGDILSIGTTTVTSHVENAKQKLDAFRRTYAVVQALRFGEISL